MHHHVKWNPINNLINTVRFIELWNGKTTLNPAYLFNTFLSSTEFYRLLNKLSDIGVFRVYRRYY